MPELAVKIKIAPSSSSTTTSGMSHHFFSWRANFKNSFSNDHMIFVKLAFQAGSGNGEIFCVPPEADHHLWILVDRS